MYNLTVPNPQPTSPPGDSASGDQTAAGARIPSRVDATAGIPSSNRSANPTAYANDLYCPECGYSLRGLTSTRCPECGLDLGFIESAESLIPWERRRQIGRFRAYWRTAWLATFRPKRFCRAAYQPVSYADAQRFRWLTIAHAFAALLMVVVTLELLGAGLLGEAVEETGWWFVCFVGVCIVLALAAFTGTPSYFFHPRWLPVERQNRAVALSYYGCGGLGYALPLALVIVGVLVAIGSDPTELFLSTGIALSIFVGVAVLLMCWICWSRMARYLLMRTGRRLAITWLMPMVLFAVCGLILLGLPAVAYYLALVYYSLFGSGLIG